MITNKQLEDTIEYIYKNYNICKHNLYLNYNDYEFVNDNILQKHNILPTSDIYCSINFIYFWHYIDDYKNNVNTVGM